MGNDGGVNVSRSIVALAGKRQFLGGSGNVSEDAGRAMERRQEIYGRCALTRQPLVPPLVVDRSGRLMCREAALEAILWARATAAAVGAPVSDAASPAACKNAPSVEMPLSELTSLKDIAAVVAPPPPGHEAAANSTPDDHPVEALLRCGVSGTACRATDAPCWVMWDCGHIILEHFVREAQLLPSTVSEVSRPREMPVAPSAHHDGDEAAPDRHCPVTGCGRRVTALVCIGQPHSFTKLQSQQSSGHRKSSGTKRSRVQ